MPRLLLAAAAALTLTGLAGAAPSATYALQAKLTARAEVPRPTGVPSGAAGAFTARAVEIQGGKARISWRLTYRKLSGRASAAHVHIGKAGKAGGVMAPLCGPCRSGRRGAAMVTRAQLRTIRAGNAYVNVHTARNPAGEIRGQLAAKLVSSGSGSESDPTPMPPPDEEPPPGY